MSYVLSAKDVEQMKHKFLRYFAYQKCRENIKNMGCLFWPFCPNRAGLIGLCVGIIFNYLLYLFGFFILQQTAIIIALKNCIYFCWNNCLSEEMFNSKRCKPFDKNTGYFQFHKCIKRKRNGHRMSQATVPRTTPVFRTTPDTTKIK